MSLNILIIPDKFKGTLPARRAAEAIARGWSKSRPSDSLELLPMSDGGDGFGEVFSGMLGAKKIAIKTVDAAHRQLRTHWWWEAKSRTAVIESANVIGLALLPTGKFHPFDLDTFGLGAVIRAAAAKGAKRCFIGIGGSATNDGGFGVARALGWEFFDREGKRITRWIDLGNLASIRRPSRTRWFEELIVAVDVQNRLLGAKGSVRVYGPQKGLKPEDFPCSESCLRQLAKIVASGKKDGSSSRRFRRRIENEPGTGAAGGLGFGLRCFAGARLELGFKLFALKAELDRRLRRADLVITGEGAMDASTMMGKGTGEVAERCRRLKIPCLGLAGTVIRTNKNEKWKSTAFSSVHALTDLTDADDARKHAAFWLEKLAEKTAEAISINGETRMKMYHQIEKRLTNAASQ